MSKIRMLLYIACTFWTSLPLSACSPINSVEPFNDQQAAHIAREWRR